MKVRTIVNFDEIFRYAEKKFKKSWNQCGDIFFKSEYFTYKGHDEFDIDEVTYSKGEWTNSKPSKYLSQKELDNLTTAATIVESFMKDNELDNMIVLN